MDLGQRIKQIRLNRGETMREFGKKLSPIASDSNVSRWEQNVNSPNSQRIKQIAELGNVSVEELLYGKEEVFDLTEVEKQIIEAYRNGADVKVTYHRYENKNLEEAMDKVMQFGKITSFMDLTEKGSFIAIQNEQHDRLEVSAFLDVKRKATHGNE